MLRFPAVVKGEAKARLDARSPRNRGSVVKEVLRSENEELKRGPGRGWAEAAHRDLLSPPTRLPAARASRHQLSQRTVRVLRSLKVRGWNRR